MNNLRNLLSEFTGIVRREFKDNLISIILFGSHAKGTSNKCSDIDLLIIVKEAPVYWSDRVEPIRKCKFDFYLRYKKIISPIILTKKEMEYSAEKTINPLFAGIMTGFIVLLDKDNYFSNIIEKCNNKYSGLKFVDRGRTWEFPIKI